MGPSDHKKIVIIGAGPTGLGAAVRLSQLGHDNWTLVEQSAAPGGLARSTTDSKGFIWDMGGHVIFSHYKYFDEVLESAVPEWLNHHRESWVWCLDRFVPYPFQNNIHRLPNAEMLECLEGVIKAKENPTLQAMKPKTFQDWINRNFGEGLARVFLNPYNFKVWAYKPEAMSAQWMGERVPVIDVKRVVRNITTGQDDVGWGPNATFKFPLHGGTGGIWTAVANKLPQDRIKYSTAVTKIDSDKKVITLGNGTQIPYDYIINTMPVNLLIGQLEGSGLESLKQKKDSFVYSTSHIIGLGLKGEPPAHLKGKCWMYFPEDDCPFYRATLFSHYSPHNVPQANTWSLMFEFSESPCKPVPAGDPIEATILGALNTKLIESRDQILSTWHERLEYGYPTPFVGRDELLEEVQPKLMNLGIWSRGRFGGWKYEVGNQDHSLMQGVEAADSVMYGVEETTYFHPDLVNTRKSTQRTFKTL